jgi:hypothetical protein
VHWASCHMDVATAGGREASRSHASDSPVPGESRMLEQPGQTKNTEELDDGFEVDVGFAVVHADDLRLAVGDELFVLGFGEECHCS